MVGEDGLEEELEMVGLRVVKEGARPPPGMTEDEFRENGHDPEVSGGNFALNFSRLRVVVMMVMGIHAD